MHGGIFICVYIFRLFPLPEDFLTVFIIGKWDTYKCCYSLGIFTHIHVHVPYTKNADLTDAQTDAHIVPVDTDSVIHKLRVELVHRYKWCTVDEHNFSLPAPKIKSHWVNIINLNLFQKLNYYVLVQISQIILTKSIYFNFFFILKEKS